LAKVGGSQPPVSTHKGTGFVKFKTKEPAAQLLELSRKVEEHLDEERRNHRLKKDVKKSVISSLTLLQNEIELNGRRLIVKSSVSKDEAGVLKEKQTDEMKRKKEAEDKRNLGMAKEGLLNEVLWIH
jgi:RNA recognition motif-containing protein